MCSNLTIKILDAAENALDNFFTLVERTREGIIYEHRLSDTDRELSDTICLLIIIHSYIEMAVKRHHQESHDTSQITPHLWSKVHSGSMFALHNSH